MTVLEICVDSFESALNAAEAGAHRLEICQDLTVGGVTPTAGFISVVKTLVNIPIFVLIRPRSGDFCYDELEVKQMVEDIKVAKQYGADGLVFGALDNTETDVSSGLPVTFHRAFDDAADKEEALKDVIGLGFQRILTSGGYISAFEGIHALQSLVSQANSRIIIMPGGGVHDKNISDILTMTKALEIHSSGRKPGPGLNRNSQNCCKDIVYNMRQIINRNELCM